MLVRLIGTNHNQPVALARPSTVLSTAGAVRAMGRALRSEPGAMGSRLLYGRRRFLVERTPKLGSNLGVFALWCHVLTKQGCWCHLRQARRNIKKKERALKRPLVGL